MNNKLKAISLSYINAPVQLRELFSFNEQGCKNLLLSLREQFDIQEALVVSTCNRTEVYYTSDIDLNDSIIDYLLTHTEVGAQNLLKNSFVKITDSQQAVKYLFEVSAGLHSQVLGDLQIAGQVKDAYQWCADVNMAGPFLHRLMHAVFYTNKRISQETSFRDGAASVSYAATELIDDVLCSRYNSKILLIGAGDMGEDTAKNLLDFGYHNISIANRTFERSQTLEQKFLPKGKVSILPFNNAFENLSDFDVVISAVQVEAPIITEEHLKLSKAVTHTFFIDLSVPRSVHTNVEKVPGVVLYNIEDFAKKTSEAQQKRLNAIPAVKEIIEDSIQGMNEWVKEMEISPTIHRIKNALETIRQEELARYQKQLNEEQFKMVETITKSIMQKIIKLPALQLKAACKRGEQDAVAEILNELFDLEKQKTHL